LQVIGNTPVLAFGNLWALAAKVQLTSVVPVLDMLVNPLEVFSGFASATGSSLDLSEVATTLPVVRPERRIRVRTMVHWPVLFFRNGAGEAIESVTQNLSSSGFYCHLRMPIASGEFLRCVLKIPSHDLSGYAKPRVLECRVRVTRVEPSLTDDTFGIGFHIQDYHMMIGEERREPSRGPLTEAGGRRSRAAD
jgi:hypothetical protein